MVHEQACQDRRNDDMSDQSGKRVICCPALFKRRNLKEWVDGVIVIERLIAAWICSHDFWSIRDFVVLGSGI